MMTALPWLKATALPAAESLGIVDVVAIVAAVVVAALVSAWREAPLPEGGWLARQGSR